MGLSVAAGGEFFPALSAWLWEWFWPLSVAMIVVFVFLFRGARPAERAFASVMLVYFFLVIVAYWLLKPIKKAIFVAYYKSHPVTFFGSVLEPAQMELLAKELNVLVALVVAVGLVWLSRRQSGLRYGLSVTLTYVLALVAFRIGMPDPGEWFVWVFYLFGDLFVTTLVAVFFSFLHEHSDMPGARRIYGLVGLGGVLGGVVGSTVVGGLDATLGASGTLELCMAILVCIGAVQVIAARLSFTGNSQSHVAHVPEQESTGSVMIHGAKAVIQSRHLKLVAAVLFLYELASVVMDYQFTSAVTAILEPAQYRSYFSSVFACSNTLALIVQLLLSTWVLRRYGPQVALYVMPIAVLVGSGFYLAFPVLLFASLLNTADSAFAYSIQQTARESAYVPLSRREKYEAKAFIDIVWLRFSKGVAVLCSLAASFAFPANSVHWLSYFVIGLTLVWFVAVRRLGASISSLTGHGSFSGSERTS